jgi:hypothetical protein
MGLLDDAIREHLELKRSRGADPNEVARQENEALGAARRAEFARPEGGEAPAETGETGTPEPAEQAVPPFDHEPSEPAAPPEPAPAADEPVSPPREAAPPTEPVVEADEPVEAGDEREPFDIEADSAGAPAEAPTQRHDWLEDEPDEVPADEALDHPRPAEPAEPAEGEDVLEETPDFLQETPEHDRLWFEQRPPRDFDWDK